jgi:PAS domain-containing protein
MRLPVVPESHFRELSGNFGTARRPLRANEEERLLDRFMAAATGDYLPLSLIVNEHMEVVQIIGDADGYLKFPSGKMVNDISKMAAKEFSIPLVTGIQKVFRQNQELRFSNIRITHHGVQKLMDLRIKPMPHKKQQEPLVAVFIIETTRDETETNLSVQSFDLSTEAEERLRDLEQELQFTRENLQATIEELFTVNAEYQSKIIELTELHNDADNLLSATQIGNLLLDENLEVRRFSKKTTEIFKLLDADVGRPITHISHYLADCDPVRIIREVQQSSRQTELEVQTHSGQEVPIMSDQEAKFRVLRSRAETLMMQSKGVPTDLDYKDVQALVHDLSVHQIQLEMQNDELQQAQLEMQQVRDEYLKLYNHAPTGYIEWFNYCLDTLVELTTSIGISIFPDNGVAMKEIEIASDKATTFDRVGHAHRCWQCQDIRQFRQGGYDPSYGRFIFNEIDG